MKNVIPFILLFLLLVFSFVAGVHYQKLQTEDVEIDSVVCFDTIRFYEPCFKDSVLVRYEHKVVPIYDDSVIFFADSVQYKGENVTGNIFITDVDSDSSKVFFPITQKVYEDSLYTAFVSGYNPSLDSIFVRKESVTTFIKGKPPRFGLGIQLGCGATTKGFQPYIGIGLHYNILSW